MVLDFISIEKDDENTKRKHAALENGDLGHRIRRAHIICLGIKESKNRAFVRKQVIAMLFFLFASSMVTYGIIGASLIALLPIDYNTQKLFNRFLEADVYQDIIDATIPDVRAWYRKQTEPLLPLPSKNWASDLSLESEGCISRLFQSIQAVVNHTSPSLVELVLQAQGLSGSRLVNSALRELLESPQDLTEMIRQSADCLSQPGSAVQSLCLALETNTVLDFSDTYAKHVLAYHANLFAVYDTLTSESLQNSELRSDLANRLVDVLPAVEADYASESNLPEKVEFLTHKVRGMARSLHALNIALGESKSASSLKRALQMNILEAVKLDASIGHHDNARVGIALAAAVPFEPTFEDQKMKWKLGSHWVDSYLAWNAAFIAGSLSFSPITKLIIPTVSCTVGTKEGESFITSRAISLALALLHGTPTLSGASFNGQYGSIQDDEWSHIKEYFAAERGDSKAKIDRRFPLAEAMGKSNLRHAVLQSPSVDTVERMLYKLCGERCYDGAWRTSESSIQHKLSAEDFKVYLAGILWLTAIITGFGLESLSWAVLIRTGWSVHLEACWQIAQFLFPLLASTCLGLASFQNYLALPVMVLGLWKFGMPEGVSYAYTGIYAFGQTMSNTRRLSSLLNAWGIATHHSAASLTITLLLSGAVVADRHIVDPILILVVQHWFVLMRYANVYLYLCIELILEVWFEWTVLSELQFLHSRHWALSLAAAGMLVSHWIYVVAAVVEAWDYRASASRSRSNNNIELYNDTESAQPDDVQSMQIDNDSIVSL